MCGKCIEGCYLAGWRNGAFSFEYMQEAPAFMGLDVMAAHGFVEVVCSPSTANRVLQNLNINDIKTLGGTLALSTIHAVCQRNVENKPLLKALLNVVKDCKGDTYIEPKQLASQIATLLSV